MKTSQTRSGLAVLPAATRRRGKTSTLLRAGVGAALLALTPSCSGDMGGDSDTIDTELVGDDFEPDLATTVDKAQFPINPTFNGFPVACSASRRLIINAADARARQLVAGAETATVFVFFDFLNGLPYEPDTELFRFLFVPGVTDLATLLSSATRMGQKLGNILEVMSTAFHTCHDGDESVAFIDGRFQTCNQLLAFAATSSVGGAELPVRWCDFGLQQDPDEIAITLSHELSHQNRTADETGIQVLDNNNNGLQYNAHNIDRWIRILNE
jgi:hypothetical protein